MDEHSAPQAAGATVTRPVRRLEVPVPPSAHRPVLSPALPRAWRDADTLQLGRAPGPALVLPDAGRHRDLLVLLDGTRTRAQVLHERPGPHTEQVLDLLEGAGLLLDADDLHPACLDRVEREQLGPDVASLSLIHGQGTPAALLRRRSARVVVHGAGRVGGPLAALLAGAGVGTVDVRDNQPSRMRDTSVGGVSALDIGRPRGVAVGGRLRSAGSHRSPALVVLADDGTAMTSTLLVAEALGRAGTPHLVARVDELVGTVGPLVLPGRSACLRCVELTRTVLDPAWPVLSAQLERPRRGPTACDGVLAAAVAAQAALQVLELLEGGQPASLGGTLELILPGWAWRRRTWPQHPGCPCAWAQTPEPAVA